MRIYHTLKPIYDRESTILILGSIPSVKSREYNFYYAHPQNRFWKILSQLYNVTLTTIESKETFLHDYHIALWDTIESCEITGSSDSSIKDIKVNNISELINKTNINKIYCTGKTSFNIYNKYIYSQTNIKAINLPSPSPANAQLSLDKLVEIYNIIKS